MLFLLIAAIASSHPHISLFFFASTEFLFWVLCRWGIIIKQMLWKPSHPNWSCSAGGNGIRRIAVCGRKVHDRLCFADIPTYSSESLVESTRWTAYTDEMDNSDRQIGRNGRYRSFWSVAHFYNGVAVQYSIILYKDTWTSVESRPAVYLPRRTPQPWPGWKKFILKWWKFDENLMSHNTPPPWAALE